MRRQIGRGILNVVGPFAALIKRGWVALRTKGIRHFVFVSLPIGFRLVKNELWSLLPDHLLLYFLPLYWRLSSSETRRSISRVGQIYVVHNADGTKTYVPSLKSPVCFAENDDRIGDKYGCDDFVQVNPSDTVVDIGAFIGEFADYAARQGAAKVVAVDPDERSFSCLVQNTAHHDQVDHMQAAVWSLGGETRQFSLGANPTESNLFRPGQGRTIGKIAVPTITVDGIANEHNLEKIDFLKLESEGLELEILRGIERVPVHKLAIDAGEPNPDGEMPRDAIVNWLESRDYEVRVMDRIVFARKQLSDS